MSDYQDCTAKIVVMDLEKTEARNVCADEGQQQFNRPPDRLTDRAGENGERLSTNIKLTV
jgi:hypothetical protein